MTKQETGTLLQILKTSYPHYYKNISQEEAKSILSLYHEMFGQYPAEVVAMALKNYIKSNIYPPTIAGLMEQIELLTDQGENDSTKLWNTLNRAICNSGYHAKEEFEKLPEVLQEWAGSPDTLRRLSMQDESTLDTVTRGQFLKTIHTIQARKKTQAALPESLKEQIKQLTDTMNF